jgi:hypothetical protein
MRFYQIMPKRIQRSRKKGWRLPPNARCVTRPGIFGNPFTPEQCREAGFQGTDLEIKARCVEAFRVWLGPHWRENWGGEESEKRRARLLAELPKLRGMDLACFCPLDQPCHSTILLELANR